MPVNGSSVVAELLHEARNLNRRNRPDLVRVNAVVVMRENGAQADHVTPRNLGEPSVAPVGARAVSRMSA
jgi:hypothetical protein